MFCEYPNDVIVKLNFLEKVVSPPPKNILEWTSTVHKNKKPIGYECPAPKQNGECGSCRACWSRSIKQVSYKEH